MKVLYITNLPAPYKIEFFELLAKEVELTVVYERQTATDRDEKWRLDGERSFKEITLKGIKIGADSGLSFQIINVIKKSGADTVIVNGYSSPTFMIAIAYMKHKGIHYGIMCDGILPGRTNGIVFKLKKALVSNAAYYLSSNDLTTKALVETGADEKKIYLYPFSSISESQVISNDYVKEEYREKIGLPGKKIILYVGRFIPVKGLDTLINAFKKLDDSSAHLMLVGSGSMEDELRKETDGSISIVGFKTPNELADYYMAADILVLPTRGDTWGLVVNEAMAYGVPAITSDYCGAGSAMIRPGENGDIFKRDDEDDLAAAIQRQLSKSGGICKPAVETAKKFIIEKMADRTYEILRQVVT